MSLSPDSVAVPARLFEAMSACYYGGGPDYWERTGQHRPGVGTPPEPDESTVQWEPPEVPPQEPLDAFSSFGGSGVRVTRHDLAAQDLNTHEEDSDGSTTDTTP